MELAGKLALLYLTVGLLVMLAMWRDWRSVRELILSACLFVFAWVTWPVWPALDIIESIRRRRVKESSASPDSGSGTSAS